MKIGYKVILWGAMLGLLMAGSGMGAGSGPNWKQVLQDRLALYGHRNWIVIADSAYPAQTAPGIETIVSHENQPEVLRQVLASIAASKSVRPIVYLDKELKYVDEKDAPGVSVFRQRLPGLLRNQQHSLLHEQLIAKLADVSKDFHVLIIKTNLTIPYTTVFLELRARYWSDEAEQKLRAKMGQESGK